MQVSEAERAQEETIRRAFSKVAGEDMEIDAYELKDILNSAYQRGTSARCDVISSNEQSYVYVCRL